jgi:hypothetical protein
MDINYFKNNIHDGMVFNKVKGSSSIIKVTDDGFTYAIGNNRNKKKITFEEVEKAIKQIEAIGLINRKWYKQSFPKRASSNPCNFTSIGGVLEALGYVQYSDKQYIKLEK